MADAPKDNSAANQARAKQKQGKQEQRAARQQRMKQLNEQRANAPAAEEEQPTEAQVAAEMGIERQLRDQRRQRERAPPELFTFSTPSSTPDDEYEEATGCRLVDLDLFNESITRLLPCPRCSSFALFCRAEDEKRSGLGGALRFWCHECKCVTHELELSKEMPRKEGQKGGWPNYEANVRLVLGAAQCGAGETQMAQLLGTLNAPAVRGTTWSHNENVVTRGVLQAAEQSRADAREAEKLAAYEHGTPVDGEGRVPITVEYDMCWAKRSSGKAYNSLEGSGSALGAVTGKVLVSKVMKKACDKCNKGTCDGGKLCNRNYTGSSGGMESTAGADMILALAKDAEGTGIRLEQYVTDLDAKTAAAVRELAATAGVTLPEQKYDPGHWKKGFGKDLIAIKSKTKLVNVLGVEDQAVIRERLATSIAQHRNCGSVDHFTAAIWNVFDHLFGRHDRCLLFFKCPAAKPNSSHVPPLKLKAWLPTGGDLETLMRQAFTKLTERKMVIGLMHGGSTQRVESLNHVRACIRPKYQHHAGSDVADQRHNLGDLRWNEGRLGSTAAVLATLGMSGVGKYGQQALAYLDHESRADSQRKSTAEGKKRRKRNRRKRSGETSAVEDGAYEPQGERELTEVAPPANAVEGATFSGELDAELKMPKSALILAWDLEHTGCNAGEKYLDTEIFELGGKLLRWEKGKATPVTDAGEFDSFVRHAKPMTWWVKENIVEAGPEDRRATPEKLVTAPTLSKVLTDWFERIGKVRRGDEPVILAGHNGHAVDWTISYWAMVKAGMDAYAMLSNLGVIGVLDTEKLAKRLPKDWVEKLPKTAGGTRRSFSNKSVTSAVTGCSLDDFVWHRAVDDARATAEVLKSDAFRPLLAKLEGTKSLIALDQLVLAVHHAHNERVKAATGTGQPATKKRRVSTCTYCGGREQPAHLSRRTCPKRLREEAAAATAAVAPAAADE